MSRVVVHRRATKYLKSLPQPLQRRIKSALIQLSESPLTYPGVICMAGDWSGYHANSREPYSHHLLVR
jgi:mRNA-degrading endonuclease RelE of RelBE toxin-antitoxin system